MSAPHTPLQQRRAAFQKWVIERDCFALLTLEHDPHGIWFSNKSEAWAYFEPLMRKITLEMDQRFLRSHHVARRADPAVRFDGIAVLEKFQGSNPHVHIGLFCGRPGCVQSRLEFLFQNLNTQPEASLKPEDLKFLKSPASPASPASLTAPKPNIVKAISARTVCHVRSIDSQQDLASYLSKDLSGADPEYMSDFKLLSLYWARTSVS